MPASAVTPLVETLTDVAVLRAIQEGPWQSWSVGQVSARTKLPPRMVGPAMKRLLATGALKDTNGTRFGTLVTQAVSTEWEESLFNWATKAKPIPLMPSGPYNATLIMPPKVEQDPTHQLPYPTTVRGWLERIRAIFGYSFREAAGKLGTTQETWELENVQFTLETGFTE